MKALYALAGFLICAELCAAQNVPPPPKPDTGPSLEVTMKYIADKLTNMQVHYALRDLSGRVPDSQYFVQVLRVDPDPAKCALSFEMMSASNIGEAIERQLQESYRFSFRDIQKLDVKDSNHSSNTSEIVSVPNTYVLTLYTEKPVVDLQSDCVRGNCKNVRSGHAQIPRAFLTFDSEDMANRVAKAMLHAVELCGGGNRDAF